MNYVLIKTDANWADEMDVSGFSVYKKPEYEQMLSLVETYFKEKKSEDSIEIYIGTNESLEYSSFNKFKNDIDVIDIAEEDFISLKKMFDTGSSNWDSSAVISFGICVFSRVYDDVNYFLHEKDS